MKDTRCFYAYIYYDPRNGDPIYVGIGKGDRAFKHWKKKANNRFFQNVLDKLRLLNLSPRIEFAALDLLWHEATALEKQLVALYGRRDQGKGPLLNLTDGGDGACGLKVPASVREASKKRSKEYWEKVDRKVHGAKISGVFAARTAKELAVVSENIKKSRTSEVRAKIGAATKARMARPEERYRHVAGAQSEPARAKRQKSLKEYSNTDVGRENRRRAANIRWEKLRAEKQLLLSDSCPERN